MKMRLINFGLVLMLLTSTEGRHAKSFGGKYARDGDFPYMALLSYTDRSKTCGASIIHERWAVTAGHCLIPSSRGGLQLVQEPYITVGSVEDNRSGTIYKVEKIFIHPDFINRPPQSRDGPSYVVNDIGLMRLKSNITFNDKVKPISLATDEKNTYENGMATTMGWGAEIAHGPTSENLRFIVVRVLTTEECRQGWPYADKHICTSNKEGQGICHGDSGSPLVVNGVQIGVVSASDRKCKSAQPDLFTKVSSFVPWIKETLGKYGDVLSS